MKKYCKYTEVVEKLRSLILEQQKDGNYLLPGEPRLAEETGASRMTVRKALKELEQEGFLKSEMRGKTIKAAADVPRKGKITFLSGGVSWICLPAWNRLWIALEAQAKAKGWDCELKLHTSDSKFEDSGFKDSDFIITTSINMGARWEVGFNAFAKGRENVIGVQEENAAFMKHVVCLDNKEAGRMAARLLLDAGYSKPAFLRQDNGYLGFIRREEGFLEEIARRMPGYEVPCAMMRGEGASRYLRDYLDKAEKLASSPVDSLFVASDGLIDVAYDTFARERRIPEDFGFVTLSGSHESLIHQPPITSVSHATNGVAKAVVELIERLNGGDREGPQIEFIKPQIHPGLTIRKHKEGMK